MSPALHLWVQLGGLAVCLFLPLWFNPFSATSFEPAKVAFFQTITGSLTLAAAVSFGIDLKNETRSTRIRHWMRSLDSPLARPVLGFVAASILATVTSIDWRLSLWGPRDNPHGLVTLLCGVAFFLLMAYVLKERDPIDHLVDALLLGSVPVALYGIAQYLGLDPLDWIANPISPSFSTLGNPNFLGAYLGILVPFAVSRIVIAPSKERWLRYGVVMLLQLVCLWLTLARGAWLGLMGGCFVFLAVLAWRWQSRALGVASWLVLLFGLVVLINMSTSVLRPWSVRTAASSQEANLPPAKIDTASVQERSVIWRNTLGLLADRAWLGYGPGTFAPAFASQYPSALAGIGEPDIWVSDPHNLFLSQLMDSGIIGLATFLWILVACYKLGLAVLARSADRQTEATLMAISGSIIAFLIQAQFNPMVVVLSALFWLDLALVVGVYNSVTSLA